MLALYQISIAYVVSMLCMWCAPSSEASVFSRFHGVAFNIPQQSAESVQLAIWKNWSSAFVAYLDCLLDWYIWSNSDLLALPILFESLVPYGELFTYLTFYSLTFIDACLPYQWSLSVLTNSITFHLLYVCNDWEFPHILRLKNVNIYKILNINFPLIKY